MAQQGIKMPSWDDLDDRVGLAPPVTWADAHLDEQSIAATGAPEAMSSNQWPPVNHPIIPIPQSLGKGDQIWQGDTMGEQAFPIPPTQGDKPKPIPGTEFSRSLLRDPKQNISYKSPDSIDGPYSTQLSMTQEAMFQNWIKVNKIPWEDSPESDYDMRGFWQALQRGDPRAKTAIDPDDKRLHYPDTWKTPYHKTFSNESIYATPDAPHWGGSSGNSLIDKNGRVLFGPGEAAASDPGTMDYYKGWANWMGFDSKLMDKLNFKNPETIKWFEDLKNSTIKQRKQFGLPVPDPKGPAPVMPKGIDSPGYQAPYAVSGTFPKVPTPQLNRDQEIAAALQQGKQYTGEEAPPGKHQMTPPKKPKKKEWWEKEYERLEGGQDYMTPNTVTGDQVYKDPREEEMVGGDQPVPIPKSPAPTGQAPFPKIPNWNPWYLYDPSYEYPRKTPM